MPMNDDQINELNRTIDGIVDEVRIAGDLLLVELMYDADDPSEFWGLASDFKNAYMFAYTVSLVACISVQLIQEKTEECWATRCLDPECMADLEDEPLIQAPEPHYHFGKNWERGAVASWHADLVQVLPFSVA